MDNSTDAVDFNFFYFNFNFLLRSVIVVTDSLPFAFLHGGVNFI